MRPNISYEGWARLWHYNQPAIVIYDALRDDGEQLGAVTIDDPEIVERPSSKGTIEEVSMAAISDSPYSVREPNDADHKQFVKLTRERGHLIPFRSFVPSSAKILAKGGVRVSITVWSVVL